MSRAEPLNGGDWDYDPTPCPNCGAKNVVGAAACWNCATHLAGASESAGDPQAASRGKPSDPQGPPVARRPCPHCGSENIEGIPVCWECGKPMKGQQAGPPVSDEEAEQPSTTTPPMGEADAAPAEGLARLAISPAEKGAIVAALLLLVGSLLPWTQMSSPFGSLGLWMMAEAKATVVLGVAMGVAIGLGLSARHLRGYLLAVESLCAVLACVLVLRAWVRIDHAEAVLANARGELPELLRGLAEGSQLAPDLGLYLAFVGAVGALVACVLRSQGPRAWPIAVIVPVAVVIGSGMWPRSNESGLSSPSGNAPAKSARAAAGAAKPAARVAVQSVDYLSEIGNPRVFMGGSRPEPGCRFARVMVVVTNTGDGTRYFDPGLGDAWTAVDQDGDEFASATLLTGCDDELDGAVGVPPGGDLRGAVYFEVPMDSRVVKVHYQPDALEFGSPMPPPAEAAAPG